MTTGIIDDLLKNGLPRWVYTWPTVLAIAVVGPFAMLAIGSVFGGVGSLFSSSTPHAPACYTMHKSGPLAPGKHSFDHYEDVGKLQGEHDERLDALLQAIDACRPDSCSKAMRETYRKAAHTYIGVRGQAAQRMYLSYGQVGLDYAESLYKTGQDGKAIRGLRQGFEAGLFDLTRLHSLEPLTRSLLFKPLSEVRLCISPTGKTCAEGRTIC